MSTFLKPDGSGICEKCQKNEHLNCLRNYPPFSKCACLKCLTGPFTEEEPPKSWTRRSRRSRGHMH